MNGISLVETETLQALISKVEQMEATVTGFAADLSNTKQQYLSPKDVMALTGFSRDWVSDHQQEIGFSTIGGQIRFKRKDLEEYMSQNYFKTKKPKRSW